MAVHQAADAFELITGLPADRAAMLRDFDELVAAEAATGSHSGHHWRKEPMMALRTKGRRAALAACVVALPMSLAACGGDDEGGGAEEAGGDVTLQLAHSYTEDQPQHRCGAQVIADEVAKADVGTRRSRSSRPASSEPTPTGSPRSSPATSTWTSRAHRRSARSTSRSPCSTRRTPSTTATTSPATSTATPPDELLQGFEDETGVHTLGAWSAGMREFTANEPIREPGDLDGLRMRFPNSPQFLMNAKALGADATEVAYEELFLALQQGTVDGQENPITNIAASSLQDVQDYISMSDHQANSNLVIIGWRLVGRA